LPYWISYVAGSYPAPYEAVIIKYRVQHSTHNSSFCCCIHLQSYKFCGLYRWSLIPGTPVRYQVRPCGICGGQSGTGTGFAMSTAVYFKSESSLQCPMQVMTCSVAYGLIAGPMRTFSYNRILLSQNFYFVCICKYVIRCYWCCKHKGKSVCA
jgi:hypothetical protein